MASQVASTTRSCYYQLKQHRPIARCMSKEALITTSHAFVSSRLHYCNVLYDGITDKLMSEPSAVNPERSCLPCYWNSKTTAHQACSSTTSLVASCRQSQVQDGNTGSSLSGWEMSSLSLRRLPAALICDHLSTEIIRETNLLRQTIAHPFWRPKFCHFCTTNLEQPTVLPQESEV